MFSVLLVVIMAATGAQMQGVASPASASAPAQEPAHVIAQPDTLVWRGQPGGLQTAIAEGNPQAGGPFTMMLKLPDGVWIQPHFHNVDKRLIVIKGELLMGHGDTIDAAKVTALKTGGVAVMPANTHHYEGGRGETIVALIANGPFTTTMVQARPPSAAAASATPAPSRIASLPVTSRVFGNTRTLRVYLPAGYDDPQAATRRYPVLYFNDGFAVFSERSWNAPRTLDELIGSGAIPPMIVVGIPNAASIDGSANPARDRTNEFLPYADATEPDLPRPRGLEYPDLVVDEVMPLIGRTFRTSTGPEHTGLAGASYGGIAALVTALRRPGVFGSLILESTPLFLFNERLITEAAAAKVLPASVWLAVGTKETEDAAVLNAGRQALDRFTEVLRMRAVRVSYSVVDGGTHTSASWAARLPAALKFLYGARDGASEANSACTARNDAALVARVRAVAHGIVDADNERAIEKVMAFYHADATLWPPNETPVRGRMAIRPRYEQLFEASLPQLTTTVDAVCVDSSIAVVEGHNDGTFAPRNAGGAARPVSDRYVMTLSEGADHIWRITHLAWRPR